MLRRGLTEKVEGITGKEQCCGSGNSQGKDPDVVGVCLEGARSRREAHGRGNPLKPED